MQGFVFRVEVERNKNTRERGKEESWSCPWRSIILYCNGWSSGRTEFNETTDYYCVTTA